jgi:hypothetical protein
MGILKIVLSLGILRKAARPFAMQIYSQGFHSSFLYDAVDSSMRMPRHWIT